MDLFHLIFMQNVWIQSVKFSSVRSGRLAVDTSHFEWIASTVRVELWNGECYFCSFLIYDINPNYLNLKTCIQFSFAGCIILGNYFWAILMLLYER